MVTILLYFKVTNNKVYKYFFRTDSFEEKIKTKAKQIIFWKKHQMLLKICANLTAAKCGVQVLAREFLRF